jgi:hypothetical protein
MLRLLLLAVSAYAYQQDLAKLPNGNTYGITLGHPGGATKRATNFANSFYSSGQKWNKAICQADTDGDGQSNGFEMGDPCCVWSVGQTPMFTTSLSDPNSAASITTRVMPNCVQANAMEQQLQMLQCPVCIQALQNELTKPSDNAADFALLSVKSCKGATQDDQQVVTCVKTLIQNADQLFKDQKTGVAAAQSCMNLGLTCTPVPTTVAPKPTTVAPKPTTVAPMPTTVAPMPTTVAPVPTTNAPLPTAPPPPRLTETDSMLPGPGVCACGKARYDVGSCDSDECYKVCDLKNAGHGVCTTKKLASKMIVTPSTNTVAPSESNIVLPVIITMISTLAMVGAVWGVSRFCKNSKKEAELDELDPDEHSFSILPDVQYT